MPLEAILLLKTLMSKLDELFSALFRQVFISKEGGCTAPPDNCPVISYPCSSKFLSLYPFRVLLNTTSNDCISVFHYTSPRTADFIFVTLL